MPTYPYFCSKCDMEYDVVKPIAEYKSDEFCKQCGNKSTKMVTAPSCFIGTKVEDAEYNPAFGCIVKNKRHRQYLAESKNLVEIGNEKVSTIHKTFDKQREDKRKKNWEDVLD